MFLKRVIYSYVPTVNVSRCAYFILVASALLIHGLWAQAQSVFPNTQLLPAPRYSEDSDEVFSLPPIDDAPSSRKDPQTDSIIKLKYVEFSGNTVFSDDTLQQIASEFINKPINPNHLAQLVFNISKHYSNHGYINSGATLPEQNLSDGILKIQIIEGRLTDINISSNGWLHPDYIRGRLQDNQPLNVNTLQERYLMLINDPLINKLNGSLKPTDVLGESQLDLEVARARPYGLSVQGNNYRPPSVGAEIFLVNSWVRNLTRWGDFINFSYGLSEGTNLYFGGIVMPLNSAGTLFSFNFHLGDNAVIEEPLNSVDIKSDVENFSWSLSHPFYKSLDHTVVLGTSFASRFSQTTLLGEDFSFVKGLDTGKNRISVVRIFQEYFGRFNRQVIALKSTFNVGIDAFNATVRSDHNIPDSQYLSWLGQTQYALKVLENGAQIRARGNLQFTNDTLLPQERMSVGGVYTVRGYRENELVRDQGYTGSIELHYPIIGQVGGQGNKLILIPFMDYGAAWNKGGSTKHLHSVGIGFHGQFIKYIRADFFYGYGINKARKTSEYNLQDSGIHFNLTLSSF